MQQNYWLGTNDWNKNKFLGFRLCSVQSSTWITLRISKEWLKCDLRMAKLRMIGEELKYIKRKRYEQKIQKRKTENESPIKELFKNSLSVP
jgi:hypothetical protein